MHRLLLEMANVPNLILIPTQPEFAVLQPRLETLTVNGHWRIELCGFGIAAAAARAAMLVEQCQPDRVILTGIAGTFDDALPAGQAFDFTRVACFGIGAGSGVEFQTAQEMGWPHWQPPSRPTRSEPRCAIAARGEIGDLIELDTSTSTGDRLLLTACSASAHDRDVQERLQKFPTAIAEDMEGFAVALACQLAEVPLQIIRGISNRAGDRDKTHWKTAEALDSAAKQVLTCATELWPQAG